MTRKSLSTFLRNLPFYQKLLTLLLFTIGVFAILDSLWFLFWPDSFSGFRLSNYVYAVITAVILAVALQVAERKRGSR